MSRQYGEEVPVNQPIVRLDLGNEYTHVKSDQNVTDIRKERCQLQFTGKKIGEFLHPLEITDCLLPDFDDNINVTEKCKFKQGDVEVFLPMGFCNSAKPENATKNDLSYNRGSEKCTQTTSKSICAPLIDTDAGFSMPEGATLRP